MAYSRIGREIHVSSVCVIISVRMFLKGALVLPYRVTYLFLIRAYFTLYGALFHGLSVSCGLYRTLFRTLWLIPHLIRALWLIPTLFRTFSWLIPHFVWCKIHTLPFLPARFRSPDIHIRLLPQIQILLLLFPPLRSLPLTFRRLSPVLSTH